MNDLPSLVSAAWLQENPPKITIVDCRFQLGDRLWGYQQYQHSHVVGAHFLDLNQDLSAPVSRYGGRHPLPEPQEFSTKLAQLGIIYQKTWVVAYDDAHLAFAARLWWLLRYLGHTQVALLDGGWPAWQKLGYPMTTAVPSPSPAPPWPIQPAPEMLVDWHRVKNLSQYPGVVLVDARDGDRYRGEREPIDPVAGHIEGAVNYPWREITDSEGYFRPTAWQKEHWQNYPREQEIWVYCGSGVTACVDILSLYVAGYERVKLYAGGWSDWCSHLP
jgi:thiosulfate/3-mercaptopyruvate sulfurtransferase